MQRGRDGDALARVQRQQGQHERRMGRRAGAAKPANQQERSGKRRPRDREEPLDAMTLRGRRRYGEDRREFGGPHCYFPRRQAGGSIQGMTWNPSVTFGALTPDFAVCVDGRYLRTAARTSAGFAVYQQACQTG
jgi:hypothetical protein